MFQCFDLIFRYVELDIDKSLVWNLQERTVVENPIIAIAHKAHSDFFLEGKRFFNTYVLQIFCWCTIKLYIVYFINTEIVF